MIIKVNRGKTTKKVYIHIYIYIHLHTYTHIHTCIYIYMHNTHIHAYIYFHTYGERKNREREGKGIERKREIERGREDITYATFLQIHRIETFHLLLRFSFKVIQRIYNLNFCFFSMMGM